MKRLTLSAIKSRLLEINPNIEILSNEYIDNKTKLKCKCLIDNHEWYSNWGNLSQGKGCKICANNNLLLDLNYIVEWLRNNKPHLTWKDDGDMVNKLMLSGQYEIHEI